jgi:hypothetical protein
VISRYDNPYEHSSEDTLDKIDLVMVELASRAVRAAVASEAGIRGQTSGAAK